MASFSGTTEPASTVIKFETRSRERACELASAAVSTNVTVDFNGNPETFSMSLVGARLGGLKLLKIETTSWGLRRNLDGYIAVHVPVKGRFSFVLGSHVQEASPSEVAVVGHPGESFQVKGTKCVGLVLLVPVEGLVERAEKIAGVEFGERLFAEIARNLDLSEPTAAALARNMRTAIAEMSCLDAVGLSALAYTGFEEALLNLATASVFPQVAQKLTHPGRDVGHSVVKKVRDHIREHATQHVDLLELSSELGVSMRALQENFKKRFGVSPRDYIMECRLEKARERLLLTDKISSVTEIALASGFSDPGRFSARYRDRYGELPSATVKQARN